ncbi:uncharacterized protein LOC134357690, partial [Mobula hypostoma]
SSPFPIHNPPQSLHNSPSPHICSRSSPSPLTNPRPPSRSSVP